MPLVCPECSSASLNVTARLELPPDSRSDEITVQIVQCSQCGFSAAAV
jgi:C4-type Zn-finger protein